MTWFPKLAAFLIALPVLLVLVFICRDAELNPFGSGFMHDSSSQETFDNLLGNSGHDLTPDLKEKTCLGRYRVDSNRKSSPHKPSYHLVNKLQEYEKLHKRCGPYTNSFNITVKELTMSAGQIINSSSASQCKYVIWVAKGGLGNRILTITSAFLYALLTNRVLLIHEEPSMSNLFCEPFPDSSWSLPKDFPLKNQLHFQKKYAHTYGNMLKENMITEQLLPSYLCLYLACDYDHHDKLFFCDQDQSTILRNIPWLIMKSDSYFIPSLFLMSSFAEELSKLFPDKETVFHHLGRYLFYPSNQVWKLITIYYEKYLAKAKERIGIQIRIFNKKASPFQLVMDQILTCTTDKEKLLPQVDMGKSIVGDRSVKADGISKAVLITSLIPDYFKKMKDMYSKHSTRNGEVIDVYQPSYEGKQLSKNNFHNQKAWAEIYLLSMMDVLVTSAGSTFGYVAQGLAGKKPWILYKIENGAIPDVVCGRAMSMEPCFHCPLAYDCKTKSEVDAATIVPHLRHCEDIYWGIKLFNNSTYL